MEAARDSYNKRILSTADVGKDVLAFAAGRGVNVIVLPFISVNYENGKGLKGSTIAAITAGQPLAFTSQHAVRAVAAMGGIDLSNGRIYCVGNKTQSVLNQFFSLKLSIAVFEDAAQLAKQALSDGVSGLTFFCGDRRLDTLPDILQENGTKVKELVVYRTTLTPEKVTEPIDGILFYSPSGVESFFSCNGLVKEVPVFVIGETTAAAVKMHCANSVYVSPVASREAVVRTAVDYFAGCCY